MTARHTYDTTLTLCGDERDVRVTFTAEDGGKGNRWEPGYPAEIDIDSVMIEVPTPRELGKPYVRLWEPAPKFIVDMIEASEEARAEMIEISGAYEGAL